MVVEWRLSVMQVLHNAPGKISLATRAWSIRIYRGYIANMYCIPMAIAPAPNTSQSFRKHWRFSRAIHCRRCQSLFQTLHLAFKCKETTLFSLIFLARCFTKRHDMFDTIKRAHGCINVTLPGLNVWIRGSFRFKMLRNLIATKQVLQAKCERILKLKQYKVSNAKLDNVRKDRRCLKMTTTATEAQSSPTYSTLSVSYTVFEL